MAEQDKKTDSISEETRLKLEQHVLKKPAEELAAKRLQSNSMQDFLSVNAKSYISDYRTLIRGNYVFNTWAIDIIAKMDFAASYYLDDERNYDALLNQSDEVLASYGRLFFESLKQASEQVKAYNELKEEKSASEKASK